MNRSTIGLSNACYCKRVISNNTVTYDDGVLLPGAVQAEIAITRDEVNKYADNVLIYNENTFRSGTITLTEAAWEIGRAESSLRGIRNDPGHHHRVIGILVQILHGSIPSQGEVHGTGRKRLDEGRVHQLQRPHTGRNDLRRRGRCLEGDADLLHSGRSADLAVHQDGRTHVLR